MAELFRIFKMTLKAIFSFLNNVSIRRNICLNFRMFTRENKRHVGAHVHGHQHGVSILISINLCETLCQITRVWNTAQT